MTQMAGRARQHQLRRDPGTGGDCMVVAIGNGGGMVVRTYRGPPGTPCRPEGRWGSTLASTRNSYAAAYRCAGADGAP